MLWFWLKTESKSNGKRHSMVKKDPVGQNFLKPRQQLLIEFVNITLACVLR